MLTFEHPALRHLCSLWKTTELAKYCIIYFNVEIKVRNSLRALLSFVDPEAPVLPALLPVNGWRSITKLPEQERMILYVLNASLRQVRSVFRVFGYELH